MTVSQDGDNVRRNGRLVVLQQQPFPAAADFAEAIAALERGDGCVNLIGCGQR